MIIRWETLLNAQGNLVEREYCWLGWDYEEGVRECWDVQERICKSPSYGRTASTLGVQKVPVPWVRQDGYVDTLVRLGPLKQGIEELYPIPIWQPNAPFRYEPPLPLYPSGYCRQMMNAVPWGF
jgi:hypothetical protein